MPSASSSYLSAISKSWRHTSALLIVSVCHRMIFARSRYCSGLVLSASGLSAILLIGGRRSCSATPPGGTTRHIDDGCDVYGIGTGPLADSIEREQIASIHAIWARAKYP